MKSPCHRPGCPILCENTYCEQHAKQQEAKHKGKLHGEKRLLDSYAWRQARKLFLSDPENALCKECKAEGRVEVATEVHHTTQHKNNPVVFWDTSLWVGLCKAHHSRHTYGETIAKNRE